eukprot:3529926-Amphidinium_carterae.1
MVDHVPPSFGRITDEMLLLLTSSSPYGDVDSSLAAKATNSSTAEPGGSASLGRGTRPPEGVPCSAQLYCVRPPAAWMGPPALLGHLHREFCEYTHVLFPLRKVCSQTNFPDTAILHQLRTIDESTRARWAEQLRVESSPTHDYGCSDFGVRAHCR